MSVQPTLSGMYWPTEHPFDLLNVTQGDESLASMAFGWTLGFGYFVICHAFRETRRTRRANTYVILIWGEILACAIFSIICWLYLTKRIAPSFWFFFFILTCWAFQVQLLLQIIVNRLCIILKTDKQRNLLRWGIAGIILAINLSVYCIWIPAKLQISDRYHSINVWWDRCEKCLYLVVDAILNYYFIHTVNLRLVQSNGLTKYRRLIRYNTQIVFISLGMDVLIIGMMSLRNDFVYMQFHPVAYMVKLNIEMAMSNLIIKVAHDTGIHVNEDSTEHSQSKSAVTQNRFHTQTMDVHVQVARQQFTTHDDIELNDTKGNWPTESSDHDGKASPGDLFGKPSDAV